MIFFLFYNILRLLYCDFQETAMWMFRNLHIASKVDKFCLTTIIKTVMLLFILRLN